MSLITFAAKGDIKASANSITFTGYLPVLVAIVLRAVTVTVI